MCTFGDVISNFYSLMHVWSNVNENEQKNVKNQDFNFSQFFDNFGRDLPSSVHDCLGLNLLCTFRGESRWKLFLPYGPMLLKTEKNGKKK